MRKLIIFIGQAKSEITTDQERFQVWAIRCGPLTAYRHAVATSMVSYAFVLALDHKSPAPTEPRPCGTN